MDAIKLANGQACRIADVPVFDVEEFRQTVIKAVQSRARLSALFGCGSPQDANGHPQSTGRVRLTAVLADDHTGRLSVLATDVADEYSSLTPQCPQAHWFEREIAEQWSVRPAGHPWLKPIRFHPPFRGKGIFGEGGFGASAEIGRTDFFQVHGEEVHEVAVGPVHAGIIEPGHFRFQCHGEDVLHLEISLGYQHRGVERAMIGGPDARTIHYAETLAGDTTVAHTVAYCQAIEALAGCQAPPRALAIRGIAMELERVANHVGDLGALAGDVGFLPTMSFCGRIRGDVLNMTAAICGNRFGRGLVRPGGVAFDMDDRSISDLLSRMEAVAKDVGVAVNLLWDSPSVTARFEAAGVVSRELAREIGLVGPAARACGIETDVRTHLPAGIYHFVQIPISLWDSGDVFARAYVRWLEIQRSMTFIAEQLRSLPASPISVTAGPPAADQLVVSLSEGWRGEVCHVAVTDGQGHLARYKVVDPSFHNWFGLACALRGQQISDFPLCNKSFNLSYCGHDL